MEIGTAPYGKYKGIPLNEIPSQYILDLLMNQDGHDLVYIMKDEVQRRKRVALEAKPPFTTIGTHYNFFRPLYKKYNWEKPEGINTLIKD